MSIPANRQLRPAPATIATLLYAPDSRYAARLASTLAPHVAVRWDGSRNTGITQLLGTTPRDWHVLLLDFSRPHAQLSADLARQLLLQDPGLALVAVGSLAEDGADCVLSAMRAGVRDFVNIDASVPEILSVLRKSMADATSVLHVRPAPTPAPKGRTVVLMGVRAGVGCSTLAVHLATLIATVDRRGSGRQSAAGLGHERPRLLVLDLGIPVADSALYLGLHCDFDCDSVLANAERFDATLARTMLSRHASGAEVLTRNPQHPAALPDEARFGTLLDRLGHIYQGIVCDLGGLLPEQVSPTLLARADEIWLVTDQSVSALIALDQAVDHLDRLGLRDDRVQLVVNRHDERAGVTAQQIAKRFELPLLAILPERTSTLRAAASQGLLLQDRHPRDTYIKAAQPLLARLFKPAPTSAIARHANRRSGQGLLGRLPWMRK